MYARKSERQWPAVDTEVDRAGGSRKYVLDVVGHRIGASSSHCRLDRKIDAYQPGGGRCLLAKREGSKKAILGLGRDSALVCVVNEFSLFCAVRVLVRERRSDREPSELGGATERL